MRTSVAVQVLRYNGERAELDLLKFIHEHLGLSVYELSRGIGWTYGKTQATVQRLIEKNLVRINQVVSNGRVHNMVFESKATELIDFEEKELELMKKYLEEKTAKIN